MKRIILMFLRSFFWLPYYLFKVFQLSNVEKYDTETRYAFLHYLAPIANRRGREILAAAQGRSALPVEASLAKLRRLGGRAGRLAELEGRASDLYALLLEMPRPCGSDFTETAIWTEK